MPMRDASCTGTAVVMWLEQKATPTAIAGGCCDVMIVVVMDDEARGWRVVGSRRRRKQRSERTRDQWQCHVNAVGGRESGGGCCTMCYGDA